MIRCVDMRTLGNLNDMRTLGKMKSLNELSPCFSNHNYKL